MHVVIVSAVRTAVGKAGRGTLKNTRSDELAAAALRGAVERLPQLVLDTIDDVIIGCATHEGPQGYNIARIASLRAGFPVSVPAITNQPFLRIGFRNDSRWVPSRYYPGAPRWCYRRAVWRA